MSDKKSFSESAKEAALTVGAVAATVAGGQAATSDGNLDLKDYTKMYSSQEREQIERNKQDQKS